MQKNISYILGCPRQSESGGWVTTFLNIATVVFSTRKWPVDQEEVDQSAHEFLMEMHLVLLSMLSSIGQKCWKEPVRGLHLGWLPMPLKWWVWNNSLPMTNRWQTFGAWHQETGWTYSTGWTYLHLSVNTIAPSLLRPRRQGSEVAQNPPQQN